MWRVVCLIAYRYCNLCIACDSDTTSDKQDSSIDDRFGNQAPSGLTSTSYGVLVQSLYYGTHNHVFTRPRLLNEWLPAINRWPPSETSVPQQISLTWVRQERRFYISLASDLNELNELVAILPCSCCKIRGAYRDCYVRAHVAETRRDETRRERDTAANDRMERNRIWMLMMVLSYGVKQSCFLRTPQDMRLRWKHVLQTFLKILCQVYGFSLEMILFHTTQLLIGEILEMSCLAYGLFSASTLLVSRIWFGFSFHHRKGLQSSKVEMPRKAYRWSLRGSWLRCLR